MSLDLWDMLFETDPAFTKHVGQRGGFTAIDAFYQVKRMTETFGPCGEGWGVTGAHREAVFEGVALAVFSGELWWTAGGHDKHSFAIGSAAPLLDSKGRLDADAYKKAMTDAATKGMSWLGLGGDVHMGMFDDSKYVESLRLKKAEEALSDTIRSLIEEAGKVTTSEGYATAQAKAKDFKATMSEDEVLAVSRALIEAKKRIPEGDY